MCNTCKNCGYRGSGYIEYCMPSAILCWCKYHDCRVTGPTCDNWKAIDMTGDNANMPIERKDKDMKEMDNTCKNCAHAATIYIWSDNDTSVMCDYHKCEITGTSCGQWTPKNMTVDKVPIKSKEVTYLPDGGVEIECRRVDDKHPDWFKNMFNDKEKIEKEYDPVNSSKHYTSGKVECIDAMIETFGVEAVKHFCLCNAFKYHWRHELKNGDEDIKKATWYMDKYKELENR